MNTTQLKPTLLSQKPKAERMKSSHIQVVPQLQQKPMYDYNEPLMQAPIQPMGKLRQAILSTVLFWCLVAAVVLYFGSNDVIAKEAYKACGIFLLLFILKILNTITKQS